MEQKHTFSTEKLSKIINKKIPTSIRNQCSERLMGKVAIPYIVSAPGCGKTQMMAQMCGELGWGLVSLHIGQIPIEELGGFPVMKRKKLKINGEVKDMDVPEMSMSPYLSKVFELSANHEHVVLFLDDFHTATGSAQQIGFQLFTERKFREFKLPDNCGLVLAGNRSIMAGTKAMLSPNINRLAYFPVTMSASDWIANYAIPNEVHPAVISFISKQDGFLYSEESSEPWCSPRSWAYFGHDLATSTGFDVSYLAAAYLSKEAAQEFNLYNRLYMGIEIDKVFDRKKEISIPEDNLELYVTIMATVFELFSRRGSKQLTNAIVVTSEIFIKLHSIKPEIVMSGIKAIAINVTALKLKQQPSIFGQLITKIQETDPEIANSISKMISEI